MECQVLLLLTTTCLQALLVNGTLPPDGGAQDPSSDEANAKIAQELLKLREHSQRFKQEMLKHAASFPKLKSMTESLVNTVNSQTDGFARIGKERLNAQKPPRSPPKSPKDSQLHRNTDALKMLEKQIMSNAQVTIGQQARKGGVVNLLPGERKEVSKSVTTLSREPPATSLTKQHWEVSNTTPQRNDPTTNPLRGAAPHRKEAPATAPERKEVSKSTTTLTRDPPAASLDKEQREISGLNPQRNDPTANPQRGATPHRKEAPAATLTVERKDVSSNQDLLKRIPPVTHLSERRKETPRAVTPHRKEPSFASSTAENTEESTNSPPRRDPSVPFSPEKRKEIPRNATPHRREQAGSSLTGALKELSGNTNPQRSDPPTTPLAEGRHEGSRSATPHKRVLTGPSLAGERRVVSRGPRTPRGDSDSHVWEGRKDAFRRIRPHAATLTSDRSEESRNAIPLKREPSGIPLHVGRKEGSGSATPPRMPPKTTDG